MNSMLHLARDMMRKRTSMESIVESNFADLGDGMMTDEEILQLARAWNEAEPSMATKSMGAEVLVVTILSQFMTIVEND